MNNFDIIIAGGGMAGATAAIALAQLGLKIALIEPVEPSLDTSPSFDQRAVALSAASINIYKTLGIWQRIQSLACPISDIHVSDQGHFGFARLNAKDYGVDALGQVIPLDQTGPILWQAIHQTDNIELFCPSNIVEIDSPASQRQNGQIKVLIAKVLISKKQITKAPISDQKNQQTLTAKLLLAADGTFSTIAKMADINVRRESYNQQAIIANISTEFGHNNRAFERFTRQGPLALLPLTRNRMSLVWCQNEVNTSLVMNYSELEFIEKLQSAFGYRLGKITKVGERNNYPLALHLPDQVFNGRVLLLGNSAHTLHPIAGQGFNIGLRDIAALFDHVQQAQISAEDIGSQQFLDRYHAQRQPDWKQTITATDTLVRIFSNDFLPLVIARNKALCLLNKIPFAKQKLAMAAMGFSGESAQLTRGIK